MHAIKYHYLLLGALCIVAGISCDQHTAPIPPAADLSPPEQPVDISHVVVDDSSFSFTVTNPNIEPVIVAIKVSNLPVQYRIDDMPVDHDGSHTMDLPLSPSGEPGDTKMVTVISEEGGVHGHDMQIYTRDAAGNQHTETTTLLLLPDLLIESIELANPSDLTGNNTFSVRVSIHNAGYSATPESAVLAYYRSSDEHITSDDSLIDTESINTIAANETVLFDSLRIPLPTRDEQYFYGVCINTAFTESDIDNNCAALTDAVDGTARPDIDISLSADTFSILEHVAPEVTATITNSGEIATPDNSEIRVVRGATDTISAADTELSSASLETVAAGGSVNRTLSLEEHDALGVYYYGVCITYTLTEQSEEIDICSETITVAVVPPTPPDITITLNKSAFDALTDTTPEIMATVANSGQTDTPDNSVIRVVRSETDTISSADTEISSASLEMVTAGGSVHRTLSLEEHATAGIYYYGICVAYTLDGETEAVDVCSETITVTVVPPTPPDITITLSESEYDVIIGATPEVTATLANSGQTDTPDNSEIRVVRGETDTITSDDTEVSSASLETVTADGSISVTLSLEQQAATGTFYYGVCVAYTLDGETEAVDVCSDAAITVIVNNPLAGDPWSGSTNGTYLGTNVEYSFREVRYTDTEYYVDFTATSRSFFGIPITTRYRYECDIHYGIDEYTTSDCTRQQGPSNIERPRILGTFQYSVSTSNPDSVTITGGGLTLPLTR